MNTDEHRFRESTGSGLNLVGSGNAVQPCRLLLSTNFSSWIPFATNHFANEGTGAFHNTLAATQIIRFYRLVML
jgi:hypothetical protein